MSGPEHPAKLIAAPTLNRTPMISAFWVARCLLLDERVESRRALASQRALNRRSKVGERVGSIDQDATDTVSSDASTNDECRRSVQSAPLSSSNIMLYLAHKSFARDACAKLNP